MKLGIMQPYFFPYLGYFQLMNAVDEWVVFDTPQYIRRGWVNRNRVLSTGKDGWKFIQIPTSKHSRNTPINEINIASNNDWKEGLIRKLDYYKLNRAPYYGDTVDFLMPIIEHPTEKLSDFLENSLRATYKYLGISLTKFTMFSSMNLHIDTVDHAGQWALNISKSMNADFYINPPGGRAIFEKSEFDAKGIELKFLTPELPSYDQRTAPFVRGLSVIDALMWCGQKHTAEMATLGATAN